MKRQKDPKIPQYWKRIWRDSRVPAASAILLMEMKLMAKLDVLRRSLQQIADHIGWKLRTVEYHIAILRKLRAIRVQNNSRRGNLCESTYFIDDQNFAKYLSETARKKKKPRPAISCGAVPTVLKDTTQLEKDLPENVILMPQSPDQVKCRL